ncbi:MAG: MCE family protein [Solirubrobacteraceae bacterium]|nr:MCE family protein [Solirubrobacteraceae bacterium]
MLTRISNPRALILPIVFALVCLLLAMAAWRAFGGPVPLQGQGYRVSTQLPEADSVLVNTDVRIAGVNVGHVTDVKSLGKAARVTMQIDPEHVPLRDEARVIVRTKTLLGEGFLEIAPGDPKAAVVRDGGTIDPDNNVRAQRLDDVLQTFAPKTRKDIRAMFAGMAEGFEGRAEDANRAIGRMPGLFADLGTVLDVVERQRDQVSQLIADGGEVFGAFADRSDAARRAVVAGDRVLATTAGRERDLSATLDALPGFLGDLRVTARRLDGATGDLNRAVRSLKPTAPLLRPALVALRDDTHQTQKLFSNLPGLFRTANKALPALRRTLDDTLPALPTIHMASRQLLPLVQLSSVSRDAFVANFANVTATMNGRMVVPGGGLGQYAGGMLTAWNEILGGWVKKLPTHRSNPYPRPGQTDNIAKGGLEAYDCRHLGNPLILPAFGGAPACKVQGPWEFNGKSRYYPRLELPAP